MSSTWMSKREDTMAVATVHAAGTMAALYSAFAGERA